MEGCAVLRGFRQRTGSDETFETRQTLRGRSPAVALPVRARVAAPPGEQIGGMGECATGQQKHRTWQSVIVLREKEREGIMKRYTQLTAQLEK